MEGQKLYQEHTNGIYRLKKCNVVSHFPNILGKLWAQLIRSGCNVHPLMWMEKLDEGGFSHLGCGVYFFAQYNNSVVEAVFLAK